MPLKFLQVGTYRGSLVPRLRHRKRPDKHADRIGKLSRVPPVVHRAEQASVLPRIFAQRIGKRAEKQRVLGNPVLAHKLLYRKDRHRLSQRYPNRGTRGADSLWSVILDQTVPGFHVRQFLLKIFLRRPVLRRRFQGRLSERHVQQGTRLRSKFPALPRK